MKLTSWLDNFKWCCQSHVACSVIRLLDVEVVDKVGRIEIIGP